jgi:cytochrome c-type biogenesis protein CcmE
VKRKNQRLVLVLVASVAVLGAVLLGIWGARDQASFFRSPGDVARAAPAVGERFRLGGMVEPGSLSRAADGVTIRFTVRDETPHKVQVSYRGIVPDLFREGSGVVAEGQMAPAGLFVANEILAKHDENYMPPELDPKKGVHKSESLE